MITREIVKAEIDKVQDKDLETLYHVIQSLSHPPQPPERWNLNWHQFIQDTYGMLADDPIERGEQGFFELREPIP